MTTGRGSDGRLRVGIAGCGIIANAHLPYVRAAGGEPVAVCDLSIATSSELADRFGIQRVYRTIEEMLACERLDAVHVL
ncbi:MAG: Gfo/Idh/MocA family oxidoreductase, partial [Vicinamibacterales bacterium]